MNSNEKVSSTKLIPDQWLSNLLQKSAYKFEGKFCELSTSKLPKGKAFVGIKIPVENVAGLLHLQSMKFQVIDTNLQFKRPPIPLAKDNIKPRFARYEDMEAVKKIAKEGFVHDRFHRDPEIDDLTASHIKEKWAENFFLGERGKWMVVIDDERGIAGFLLLLHDELEGNLIIDLIAVAGRSRQRGFARSMMSFALNECSENTVAVKVGTQISNYPSIRFYTNLGFKLTSASYVLHLHLNGYVEKK